MTRDDSVGGAGSGAGSVVVGDGGRTKEDSGAEESGDMWFVGRKKVSFSTASRVTSYSIL